MCVFLLGYVNDRFFVFTAEEGGARSPAGQQEDEWPRGGRSQEKEVTRLLPQSQRRLYRVYEPSPSNQVWVIKRRTTVKKVRYNYACVFFERFVFIQRLFKGIFYDNVFHIIPYGNTVIKILYCVSPPLCFCTTLTSVETPIGGGGVPRCQQGGDSKEGKPPLHPPSSGES